MKIDIKINKLKNEIFGRLDEFSKSYQGVVVSCSAGVDSTVLFDIISQYNHFNFDFSLKLFYFNFNLRLEENIKEVELINTIGKLKKAKTYIFDINEKNYPKKNHETTQMWARRVRYETFEKTEFSNHIIVLAHHGNDLIENMFFRMARGSGIMALTGMSEWHAPFYRPLLKLTKKEIIKYANLKQINYCQDSSNQTLCYTRNIIRHEIVQKLNDISPSAEVRMVRLAHEINEQNQFMWNKLQPLVKKDELNLEIPPEILKTWPRAILGTLVHEHLGRNQALNSDLIHKILNAIENRSKKSFDLKDGHKATVQKGVLVFKK